MPDPITPAALVAQFATALVGGVVGGVLGTGFKWVEQRAERSRRRKALATAMLNDLRGLELNARQIRESDYAAKVMLPGPRPGEIIVRVVGSDDLHLFTPDTVSRLHYLATLVASLWELPAIYAKVTSGQDRATLNTRARAQAHFVAGQIGPARAALEREGGTPPLAEPLDVALGTTLPPLGPTVFSEWTIPDDEKPGEHVLVNEAGRPMPDDVRRRLGLPGDGSAPGVVP